MKMDNITLNEAAAIAKPYDERSYAREEFIKIINEYPQFQEAFENQFSDELKANAEEKGIYFIVNKSFTRNANREKKTKLRVGFCGPERFTTISVDC